MHEYGSFCFFIVDFGRRRFGQPLTAPIKSAAVMAAALAAADHKKRLFLSRRRFPVH